MNHSAVARQPSIALRFHIRLRDRCLANPVHDDDDRAFVWQCIVRMVLDAGSIDSRRQL